ncbi:MAG: altronate dehydratase [Candidatus Omnitrophota bacterium]|jgi:altronate hydrolase|nr:MAG: altronate dehydratase [Candidatus Omnitrophota bacterium]
MSHKNNALRLHANDNVATAVCEIKQAEMLRIEELEIPSKNDIPAGHKIALRKIETGENIIKYGWPIGHAKTTIATGEWVHEHNVETNLSGKLDYRYKPELQPVATSDERVTFQGFIRNNGDIGIRNEIWIVPLVGCVNEVARTVAQRMNRELAETNIDGVYAWTHPYGCSQLGDDLQLTRKILASLVRHPNAAGVLVLGLGCENNTLDSFRQVLGESDPKRVKFLVSQDMEDEIESAMQIVHELVTYGKQFRREPIAISRLRVGLECGGSDGFSGITANPLVGVFSDRLVALDGTVVLSEVTEMFGAEEILMKRCVDQHVFEKCVAMINDYKDYLIRYKQPIDKNPSPGNKKGGLTTLEEKSLGCILKGGSSPIVDVLDYGELLKKAGLNLLTGPGNDLVSVTLLAASGAHLILFTTGRGTPLGSPVPTLKISTTSELAGRKKNWIDFDAGILLEGASTEETSDRLFLQVLNVASGVERTRNEVNDFREIAIMKDGVTV